MPPRWLLTSKDKIADVCWPLSFFFHSHKEQRIAVAVRAVQSLHGAVLSTCSCKNTDFSRCFSLTLKASNS